MEEVEAGKTQDLAGARDILIISAAIPRQLHVAISNEIQKNKRNKECTVFLTTYGGDPDGGYRIGRCLRHHYESVRVVVPSMCKSAGTRLLLRPMS